MKKRLMIIGGVFIFLMAIICFLKSDEENINTEKGKEILQTMAENDVDEVNKKIQEIEKRERVELFENGEITLSQVFEERLIIGDSITQGLYEYEVLSKSYVIADRGTEVTKVANKKIEGHVEKAKAMKPRTLFLAYGMNDLTAQMGKTEGFVKAYKELLEELKEALPNTEIYVNSILPASEEVADERTEFKKIPEFNQALQELCQQEEVMFIDNTSLVNEEDYAPDGVHVTTKYYEKWVHHMVEVAGV